MKLYGNGQGDLFISDTDGIYLLLPNITKVEYIEGGTRKKKAGVFVQREFIFSDGITHATGRIAVRDVLTPRKWSHAPEPPLLFVELGSIVSFEKEPSQYTKDMVGIGGRLRPASCHDDRCPLCFPDQTENGEG